MPKDIPVRPDKEKVRLEEAGVSKSVDMIRVMVFVTAAPPTP